MIEDMDVYLDKSDGISYIESLIRSRTLLCVSKMLNADLITNLEETISLEVELATIGAKKALLEVKKEQAKDNIKPIK